MGLAKARITKLHNGDFFDVMFNPEEYTLNRDNNFAAQSVPGLSSPLLQFVAGNLRTLEMELFFDTFEKKTDVRDDTGKVIDLLQIDSDLHAPPVVLVSWGSLQFTCVLAKASQRFNMFLDDGRPARARLSVTFNEYIDEDEEAKQVNRQTADFTKAYTVEDGDTLSGLAGRIYEDPSKWRALAVANAIDNPRSITPGQRLIVPSLPYTDALTGEVIR
jgi:LysM repeat protein